MNQMGFNILQRAQSNARKIGKLTEFLSEHGVELKAVQNNPDYYSDLIKQYSKACINVGLFEESREHLQMEFNKLCEYHARNEEELTDKFYNMAREIILASPEYATSEK